VLLDLGVSSMQLDEGERGFAFRQEGPLDMRMSSSGPSAADLVADSDEAALAALIYRYGEERHSRRLARAIVAAREEQAITTTGQLAEVIQKAYPGGHRREHPARRTFQALRIAVNDELGALEQVMADAPALLESGGRLVVISYHSLEDRIVKHALLGDQRMEVLVKRPVTASETEQEENPRSRSAKLRAATRRAL
jgi:16S rRNA (cytosine1402-N4)-methyltransferase